MMEWANFYNGVSRGLSTILNCGDGGDFGLSNQTNRSKELKRMEQMIVSKTNWRLQDFQIYQNEREARR